MSSSEAPGIGKALGIPVMLIPFLITEGMVLLIVCNFLEIGRVGSKPFRELGPIHSRCTVTIGAPTLGKLQSNRLNFRRFVEMLLAVPPFRIVID